MIGELPKTIRGNLEQKTLEILDIIAKGTIKGRSNNINLLHILSILTESISNR